MYFAQGIINVPQVVAERRFLCHRADQPYFQDKAQGLQAKKFL